MTHSFPFSTCLITGGSSGLGRALAFALAKRGCKIGLLARNPAPLKQTAQELREQGYTADFSCVDIGNHQDVQRGILELSKNLGEFDLVICNAGISIRLNAHNFDSASIEKVYRTNVLGLNFTIAAALPAMVRAKRGCIVGISSLASYRGLAGHSTYSASKAAVNTQLEGLRTELVAHGIKVLTVCPGYIATPMTKHHNFKLPFLLDANRSAEKIIRAIESGKTKISFPWPMALLLRIVALLPNWIYDRIPKPYLKMPQ